MFFNPGEMEALLDARTNPLVWLDAEQIERINVDFGHEREIVYRPCPMCSELMSHLNFGGRSGVIIDRCGTHGVWLEGSQLRRLTEWWRAGGKLIYQQNEEERVKRLYGTPPSAQRKNPTGSIEPPAESRDWFDTPAGVAGVIGAIIGSILG